MTMNNFEYYNPVKIIFGKGSLAKLPELIPSKRKVLIIFDKNAAEQNGLYRHVIALLKNFATIEFSEVTPNPTHETCLRAIKLAKSENVDFLLAVGGGSVIDATKYIAAAVYFSDPWNEIMIGKECVKLPELTSALDFGCVLTVHASSSEMNSWAAISNKSTKEKFAFSSPLIFPKFSIIDPELTFSLPREQTINSIIDIYIHVLEQYATYEVNAPLQDRQAEAILKTLIEESNKLLNNPYDYDARANICWCATNAYNSLISRGVPNDWSTHMIGHELTALYGVSHAASVAIVLPRLWEIQKKQKRDKLLRYAVNVLNICSENKKHIVNKAIIDTEEFFKALGMKTKLIDYGIDSVGAANKVAKRFSERKIVLGENLDITPDVVKNILLNC